MFIVDWFMTKLTRTGGRGRFFSINDYGSTIHYSYGIKRNLQKGSLQNTVTVSRWMAHLCVKKKPI